MRYIELIKQHWIIFLLVTVIMGGTATGLSFIPDQYYESSVQLLIVQADINSDSYTDQKAAEKIGKSLVNVSGSLQFLDRVIQTGFIGNDWFSENSKDKKSEWEKLAEASVVPETGIINVSGFGTDQGKAEDVALGVAQVFTSNSSDYHGGGDSVSIKLIDGPITSIRPVRPNIPLNGAAGAVLGFMIVFAYYILRMESETITAEKQQVSYQALNQGAIFPLSPPDYKVLDEFPNENLNYGATTKTVQPDDTAVTMDDHMK